MSLPAFDTTASISVTRQAADPRADGACRTVHVSPTAVTIERTLEGVRMRVGVPVAAYAGLVIAVQAPCGRATLSLRHDDRDLDVVFGSGNAEEVARTARAWSRVLGKDVAVEAAFVAMRGAFGREDGRASTRFSAAGRRRRAGVVGGAGRSFAAEHEIIARD